LIIIKFIIRPTVRNLWQLHQKQFCSSKSIGLYSQHLPTKSISSSILVQKELMMSSVHAQWLSRAVSPPEVVTWLPCLKKTLFSVPSFSETEWIKTSTELKIVSFSFFVALFLNIWDLHGHLTLEPRAVHSRYDDSSWNGLNKHLLSAVFVFVKSNFLNYLPFYSSHVSFHVLSEEIIL